ncbi:MAG TPA: GYD domain-containing protein [Gammaproteobacteria bacterium]|nr:GYD domain-containing protein [Gammaproteobacteria bacterium]
MARYIVLLSWTDQGIRNIRESSKRLDDARRLAGDMGVELGDFYMTIGPYDMVSVVDAPDDASAARFALRLGAGGNVRTTTLKAFPEKEYREIVGSLG